ncbi:MAG TPA: bifunctional aspartate kinase/homoserine dehydrogenase I [Chitinophagaceae bacterium]|jgi:aspartokinase/homoserine dehydrogenase 1|nr:bifunctional aspartate kinase/homoserine dehydrogenase I [Chitinophagaceae bacterium]
MLVLKFGGTSVGSAENIEKVITIVREKLKAGKLLVVVSAMGGATDALLECGKLAAGGDETYKKKLQEIEQRHISTVKELIPVQQQSALLSMVKKMCNEIEDLCNGIFLLNELSVRTIDKLLSYGELLSSQMITAALVGKGTDAKWVDSREIIKTNSEFGNATVDYTLTNENIQSLINADDKLFIIPGFVASDAKNITTTLGRGGSDFTAAIFAAAVNAASLEIWTDVSGMMTADPRWVANAKIISSISYQEAMELSHFGAKVIYPPTIQPVLSKNIPVWIKNTFAKDEHGTVIKDDAESDANIIRGISSINNIALLSLEGSGMVGVPGFSKRLFESLSGASINVILITQGSSEHSICVGVDAINAEKAKQVIDQAFTGEITMLRVEPLIVEKDLSIVALVGDHMKSHPGISGKMFGALGKNGVNVRAIAQGSSERNISAVVSTADVRKAINVLHEEFFETSYKQINIFIAGAGNVGSKLIRQLHQQQMFLRDHLRLQIRVVGIANSKRSVIKNEGIDLSNWEKVLADGKNSDIEQFVDEIIEKNLRNSIFVDVTASDKVAEVYERLLQKTVSVVACNKIACSSPYARYRKLKELSNEFNASFLFETNVGAGLPVIGTLSDLIRSGDNVQSIEAVLSGTLNFVFNHYDGKRLFADVVQQAQDEGYTEPDPRLDLSGKDVMRKIMILARETGEKIEMDDIENNSFMPESCMQGSVENFYAEMRKHEDHFKRLYDAAAKKGHKLKFVARYDNGKAAVGLQHISSEQDLYHLYGKDNVVLFYTDRYTEQPLVVKGAGAGAEVTASGVFADIMRAARVN